MQQPSRSIINGRIVCTTHNPRPDQRSHRRDERPRHFDNDGPRGPGIAPSVAAVEPRPVAEPVATADALVASLDQGAPGSNGELAEAASPAADGQVAPASEALALGAADVAPPAAEATTPGAAEVAPPAAEAATPGAAEVEETLPHPNPLPEGEGTVAPTVAADPAPGSADAAAVAPSSTSS